MRTFQPTYRDKKGKTKKVGKWWVELRDHHEIVRRFAGFPDRKATEELGRKIQKLISFKLAGLLPDQEMTRWLQESVSDTKLEKRLVEVGLLDERRIKANKPILEHLEDFEKVMYRNCNKLHASVTVSMIKRIIEDCNFKYWSEVKSEEIEEYLHNRKDISINTEHSYATAFKHFGYWMVENKRANSVPKIKLDAKEENYRPGFEKEEIKKILEAAINGPKRYGLSGYERYMLYVLAIETTFRRGELETLTASSYSSKDRTIFLKGEPHTKHKKDVTQVISESTAAEMENFVRNKLPTVKLFNSNQLEKSAQMLHEDCKAAGVDIYNAKGEKRVFHSLRHTGASFLADVGVHPKVIQERLRHKDINLTMNRYTHTMRERQRKAVNSLPDFKVKRATGTE